MVFCGWENYDMLLKDKNKMKKLLLAVFILSIARSAYSAACTIFDTADTGSVVVSTTSTSPTILFHKNALDKRSILANNTSGNLFLVGDSTTTYGTAATVNTSTVNGSWYMPPNSTQTFDGVNDPYLGNVWGVLSSSGSVQVWRCR